MATERDRELLLAGVEAWNAQRGDWNNPPDLSGLDFFNLFASAGKIGNDREIPLAGYRFPSSNLAGARLFGANLRDALLILADLTDASLSGVNLIDAKIDLTNLTRADLTDANLTRASLTRASLTDADLTDADLTDADLTRANLTRANLTRANLTNADLTRANFTDAVLHSATLDNASCQMARFIGADLTGTKLWEVVTFDGADESPKQYKIALKPVTSVGDLLARIGKIKSLYQVSEEGFCFYFRGASRSTYDLQPSVMRKPAFSENEGAMLTNLAARRPEEFNGLVSGLAQLVTAQHYGLKTRFLDISSNILVALFHACGDQESIKDRSKDDGWLHVFVAPRQMVKPFNSDTVSVIANYARLPRHHQMALVGQTDATGSYSRAMEQLVQLIQSEKPYFAPRINPRDFYRVIIVEPQQSPERIRVQSGAFLVSVLHDQFELEEILRRNPNIPVYAHYPLTVSNEYKTRILDELRMMNITRETLFPGLDTAAKAIMESYRQRQP